MISHVLGLFTHPKKEWTQIKIEHESISHIYLTHILVLAAIPSIAAFIGTTQIGWELGSSGIVKLTIESGLKLVVAAYSAMLVGVLILGCFIHWMSKTYDANPTISECVIFSAYTATPLFIGGIVVLYPHLWLCAAVGTIATCYTIYLVYIGIPKFMRIDEDEGFLFSSSILAVGLIMLVALIATSVIFWGYGFHPQYITH